jgi:hypothetical protein
MKTARTIISWAQRGAVIAVYLAFFGWIAWEPLTFALLKHRLDSVTNAAEERAALGKAGKWGRLWEAHLRDSATGRIAPNLAEQDRLINDPDIQVELDIEWLKRGPFGGGGVYYVSQRIIDKANIAHFYESQTR